MMNDSISRRAAIDALCDNCDNVQSVCAHYPCKQYKAFEALPPAQPEPTLYGYPIEHLVMIARVMKKEHCTPEDVVRMLQNAGEIAKMVHDEMMRMLKESVERTCKGVADDSQ